MVLLLHCMGPEVLYRGSGVRQKKREKLTAVRRSVQRCPGTVRGAVPLGLTGHPLFAILHVTPVCILGKS